MNDDGWDDLREWLEALRREAPDVPGDEANREWYLAEALAGPLLARLMTEQPLDDLWRGVPFTEALPGRCTEEELMERVGEERIDAFWALATAEVQELRDRVERRKRFVLPRRRTTDL